MKTLAISILWVMGIILSLQFGNIWVVGYLVATWIIGTRLEGAKICGTKLMHK